MTVQNRAPIESNDLLVRVCGAALRKGSPEAIEAAVHRNLKAYCPVEEAEATRRAVVRTLARRWAPLIPTPANRFRPAAPRDLGPNDPCPCESGRTWQACCQRILSGAAGRVTTETLWPYALYAMSAKERRAAIASGMVPITAQYMTAHAFSRKRRHKDVVVTLKPLFADPLREVGAEARLAFEILYGAFQAQGNEDAASLFVDRIYHTAPPSPLRAGAIAVLFKTAVWGYELADARRLFKEMQRDDRLSVWLAVAEIELLIAEKKIAQARVRASVWRRRLERAAAGAGGAADLGEFLAKAAADPIEAHAELSRAQVAKHQPELLAWVSRLEALVTKGCARPIPKYPLSVRTIHTLPWDVAQERKSAAPLLASAGIPPEILETECAWRTVLPPGMWDFGYAPPLRVDAGWERQMLARGWGEALLSFLGEHPEAFDSMQILDQVGVIGSRTAAELSFQASRSILSPLLRRAERIAITALAALPRTAQLDFVADGNLPLVLALRCQFQHCVLERRFDESFELADLLLRLDPSDPYELRGEMIAACLREDRNVLALTLAQRYPAPDLAVVRFGELLALRRLAMHDEAAALALRLASSKSDVVRFFLEGLLFFDPDPDNPAHALRIERGPLELLDYRETLFEEWWRTPHMLDSFRQIVEAVADTDGRYAAECGLRTVH